MPSLLSRLWEAVAPPAPAVVAERDQRLAAEQAVKQLEAERDRWQKKAAESYSLLDLMTGPYGVWGGGFRDPLEQDAYGYGGGMGGGLAGRPGGRKKGGDWPLLQNVTQLDTARGKSRLACDLNSYAAGMVDRSVDFVVGDGMKVSFTLKGAKTGAVSTGVADADGGGSASGDPRVEKVEAFIDEFRRLNSWGCGVEDREEEGYRREMKDDEVLVRFFMGGADTNGVPRVRWVDPEYLRPPPDAAENEKWGIRHPEGDVETHTHYHLANPDDTANGKWVVADRVVFYKTNTDATVLRGFPAFGLLAAAFEECEALNGAIARTSAVQAKIAYVRQHAPGMLPGQITSFVDGQKDADVPRRARPWVGGDTTRPTQWLDDDPLTVDMGNGMQFQAGPASTGVPGFVQGLQSRLRQLCARFGYPEFFTGDASNNNYASILVAGGPFEKAIRRRQRRYAAFQEMVYRKAVALAVEAGRLSAADAAAVEIAVQPGSVAMANKLEEAQVNQIKVQNKALSPQEWIQEDGRDPAVTLANLKAMGGQVGGDGMPDGQGGGGRLLDATDGQGGDASSAGTFPGLSESERPLGPPPFEGAVFDKSRHRWVKGTRADTKGGTPAADRSDPKAAGANTTDTPAAKLSKGQALTGDAVWDAVKGDSDTAAAKVSDMARDVAYDVADVKTHGMSKAVKVKKVTFNGVDFLVQSSLMGKKGEESPIGQALLNLSMARLPPELHGVNRRVVLTAQPNGDDGYWEKEYGVSGFKAAATGGDGDVVVYGVGAGGAFDPGIYAHESGHNVANAVWGSQSPPADSEYAKAAEAEPPVSEYGKHSPAEDFAEAVREYHNGGDYLEKVYPKKYAAVKNIMAGLKGGHGNADSRGA
jgi:hypothetical protein